MMLARAAGPHESDLAFVWFIVLLDGAGAPAYTEGLLRCLKD